MRNIIVIIKKQFKDTLGNKTILIQFLLFPLISLIMEKTVTLNDMPELFFTKMFAVMYIGMAPLTSMAAIIAEEKEKNTLRVLMMANVKPYQYLIGVGIYVWTICMMGALVMSVQLPGKDIHFFLLVMGAGFILSIILGACIGIYSKNQMMATSLVMPCMLILSFAPMLSMFNEKIRKASAGVYTQQLKKALDAMSLAEPGRGGMIVVIVSMLVFVLLFAFAYHRKGLE